MARGLRSSRLKANNTKLRTNVFSPIEDARMARLSKKQTDLAASATALPRMEVDTTIPAPEETSKAEDPKDEAMNVDEDASIVAKQPSKKPKNTRKEIRKIKKDSKRKPRNLISFKKKAVNPNAKRRRMPRI